MAFAQVGEKNYGKDHFFKFIYVVYTFGDIVKAVGPPGDKMDGWTVFGFFYQLGGDTLHDFGGGVDRKGQHANAVHTLRFLQLIS